MPTGDELIIRDAVPRTVSELDTPCALVDLNAVDRNIAAMQGYCDEHGIALRPHVKTHKTAALARRQLDAGAAGLACQTVAEIEAMAAGGFTNLLLCVPALDAKASRLARLAGEISLSVAVDSSEALMALADALEGGCGEIGILVECDTGGRRAGVQDPGQAAELAELAAALPGVRFLGLMTHPTPSGAAAWLSRARASIKALGIEVETVSVGGTGAAGRTHELGIATELRAGTYLFGDRSCIADGSVSRENCALRIGSQVRSRPTCTRAILDAGSKSLSSDPAIGEGVEGFGVLDEYPDAELELLSEEHGHLQLPEASEDPEIGERVSILPNHACAAVNLHNRLVVHRNGAVIGELPVLARRD
jgi:D-serine deaminase-like pyridoxal phosphate-dependent protein